MTRGRASPGVARTAALRVDSGENTSFKSLRYRAMNARYCPVHKRRPLGIGLRRVCFRNGIARRVETQNKSYGRTCFSRAS